MVEHKPVPSLSISFFTQEAKKMSKGVVCMIMPARFFTGGKRIG